MKKYWNVPPALASNEESNRIEESRTRVPSLGHCMDCVSENILLRATLENHALGPEWFKRASY